MEEKTLFLKDSTSTIKQIAGLIKQNKIVVFKTDTIYGISSNIFSDSAVEKIYEAKRRNEGKPLIMLVPQDYEIEKLVKLNEIAKKLISRFWPGPLTIIFEKQENVKLAKYISTTNKISLRMPSDELCLKILNQIGEPITSTSANISGEPTPDNALEIFEKLNGKVSVVLDSGIVRNNTSSTIVDIADGELKIIREGAISVAEILKLKK